MRSRINKSGFTLAELLIVVAIIGVLVSIGVVVFINQLEKARQAADMTMMRHAKTALVIEYTTGSGINADGMTRYYYNNRTNSVSAEKIAAGFGQSKTDAGIWWTGDGHAYGVPNMGGGHPSMLALTISQEGVVDYYWCGAYFGENVHSQTEYQALSYQEKLDKDILLLDSLQGEFRAMTYGEIRYLLYDQDGKLKEGLSKGNLGSDLCITIANGTITSGGQVVIGSRKTQIYLPGIFENTGFDTNLDDSETYIINSVVTKTNTIWINLRISENELKSLNESSAKWDQFASRAYTYVKSDGATTPDPLREAIRRNS